MPDAGPDRETAGELGGLLAERDALHRRLAWVDTQVTQLQVARQEVMSRRLASLEASVLRLATAPRPVQPQVTDAMQPVPFTKERVQPPMPEHDERTAAAPLAAYTSPTREGQLVGWIPRGSRFAVTELTSGARTQVIYQATSAWVDSDRLVLAPMTGAAPAAPALLASSEQPIAVPAIPSLAGVRAMGMPSTKSTRVDVPAEALVAEPKARPAQLDDLLTVPRQAAQGPPVELAPFGSPAWSRPGFMPKLLALVGAAVTLIGVAFLLILAAQYGMFGPLAQTISAAGLGVVLVALAFAVRGRDPGNVGAPILGATGVATGFLSVVTATVIYHWLPPLLGVALAALVGLGGMVLARLWDNEWVALVSVLGSLMLAVFVGTDSEPVTTAGLMLVMTAVTLWFERGTGWRLFPFARVLPTVMVLLQLTWRAGGLRPDQMWWLVVLTVCLALLGLVSALIAPAQPSVGQAIAVGLLAPMVAPALLAAPQLPSTVGAALILAGVAAVYCACGFLPWVEERVRWAAVPIGAGFALLAVFTATQHRYFSVLALAFAVVYLAVAARTRSGVNLIVGGILGVVGLFNWLPLLIFSLDQESAAVAGPEQIAQSLVGIAVVVFGTMAATRWFNARPRWSLYLSWSMATAMGSVAIIHLATWIGVQAGNAVAGFQAGQAIVTVAWMVLCIVFLQRGLAAKEDFDVWLHLALAIAALAVAKLFLLDLGMLNAIARVGAFLAVGLLLLFVGTRYAKAWERAHGDDVAPGAPVATESPATTESPVTPDVQPAGGAREPASPRSSDLSS